MNVGLDIGATKTLGVVVDADGRVLAQERLATAPGAEGIVATAVGVVEALAAAAGAVTAVGVGVPGLVDVERGALAHAVNLGVDGEWLPLGDLLASRLGVPVSLENDVNAAALGAVALTGVDDLVYLSIGTGLAAGLVLDGRLRRGVSGAAGEIGHVPVDPAGAACQCGQRGCLETVASGRAITDAWPSGDVPAAQALFAAAAAGDVRAVAVRDRFAAGVADAVRVLGLSLDPGVVMLGGGVAQLGEPLRAAVSSALHDQAIASPFLASLDLAGRLRVVPVDHPVAAVGAALLGPREAVA
ncbi:MULTISPECIES: ROK family protein [Nocardioides]|uniref:ROK family protein n=1 Tax=Nocardioides TaxID=1839 RepID=UPI000A6A6607|nr:ROK family protein [Nocardioides lianchengensis]NYG13708.1 putative NBD/HSP70 family sugar kinase [Nocardioides lianchengensis]